MKVQLVAVGNKMPAWVQTGFDEYAKRLPKELCPKVSEIAVAQRGKSTLKSNALAQIKAQEGQAILGVIPKQSRKIMLDLGGKPWSTQALSQKLSSWMMDGDDLAFVIGGPDGLSKECLAQADDKWALSPLTLPHPLVRVVWIEQMYRAWTILQNHPYHK